MSSGGGGKLSAPQHACYLLHAAVHYLEGCGAASRHFVDYHKLHTLHHFDECIQIIPSEVFSRIPSVRVEHAIYSLRAAPQIGGSHARESHGDNTVERPEPPADLTDSDLGGVRLSRAGCAQNEEPKRWSDSGRSGGRWQSLAPSRPTTRPLHEHFSQKLLSRIQPLRGRAEVRGRRGHLVRKLCREISEATSQLRSHTCFRAFEVRTYQLASRTSGLPTHRGRADRVWRERLPHKTLVIKLARVHLVPR